MTQYWPPSWTADSTAFTVDSISILYTADGGAQSDGSQIIAIGPPNEVLYPDVTGKQYNRPAGVQTTIAYF